MDLHYRDLNEVEYCLNEAEHGRCTVERLPFYLAGIPTYGVVGELALSRILVGHLPYVGFPATLRASLAVSWTLVTLVTAAAGSTIGGTSAVLVASHTAGARAVTEDINRGPPNPRLGARPRIVLGMSHETWRQATGPRWPP